MQSTGNYFKFIINLFLTVSISQFRKDYLTAIKREKSKALRKKVMEKTSKAQQIKRIDMNSIINDKSENRLISHLHLKSLSLENENFFLNFTKKDLILLLKAYGVHLSMTKKKQELGEVLAQKLGEYDSMLNSSVFKSDVETEKQTAERTDIPSSFVQCSGVDKDLEKEDLSEVPEHSNIEYSQPPETGEMSSVIDAMSDETELVSAESHETSKVASGNKTKKTKCTRHKTPKSTSASKSKRKAKRKASKLQVQESDPTDENCGICGKKRNQMKNGYVVICAQYGTTGNAQG